MKPRTPLGDQVGERVHRSRRCVHVGARVDGHRTLLDVLGPAPDGSAPAGHDSQGAPVGAPRHPRVVHERLGQGVGLPAGSLCIQREPVGCLRGARIGQKRRPPPSGHQAATSMLSCVDVNQVMAGPPGRRDDLQDPERSRPIGLPVVTRHDGNVAAVR